MRRIAFVLLSFACVAMYAQEATKWRGPAGDGTYPESGLLDEWPAEGPELLWSFEGLGEGFSSPVFANGRIYINGLSQGKGNIFVLDENGNQLKKFSYGDEFSTSYPGSRSSVAVAGELMYIMSGTGKLTCLESETGRVKWDRNLFRDFDGKNLSWGVTETLVIDGERLYVTPGGRQNNVVALNRFTGNLIWSSKGKSELSAYCTPLLVKLPGRKILVTHTANNIICLDAADGRLVWSQGHPNAYDVHANTPIYADGAIYCFTGYGQGGILIELDDNGEKKSVRWKEKTLDSRMGGAVLVDGWLYGSGDANRSWKSINWNTGEQGFSSSEVGNGVIIAADGKLFMYSQRGEVAMAIANPRALEIKGKFRETRGSGQHWAHPVINKGRLFIRHGNALMAYKIK